MWLVAFPRSQFSRVTCLTHPGGSATSRWSELPHNSRPLTFGTLLVPPCHLPLAHKYADLRLLWTPLIGTLGLVCFLFGALFCFCFFLPSIPCVLHPPPKKLRQSLQFGRTRAEILLSGSTRSAPDFCLKIVLRGYGDDLHLLDSCLLGTLSPGRCPVAEKRAPVTRRYFGVIGDLFMSFSPHLLFSLFSASSISHYPFIAISLFSISLSTSIFHYWTSLLSIF